MLPALFFLMIALAIRTQVFFKIPPIGIGVGCSRSVKPTVTNGVGLDPAVFGSCGPTSTQSQMFHCHPTANYYSTCPSYDLADPESPVEAYCKFYVVSFPTADISST